MLLNISFLITSLFTFHFPSWKLAMSWAKDNLQPHEIPNYKFIVGHTFIYLLQAIVIFPILAIAIIFANKEAIRGYTKSLIQMLMRIKND